jgi:hypothetical protein
LVLIAGHTHRPVFESLTHEGQIEEDITTTETLLKDYPENKTYTEQLSHLEAELEWVRAQQIQQPHEGSEIAQTKPSYFNTGCCCYRDGDITGIEITAGEIRLVRWPSDDDQPKRKVLAHALMEDDLARC